MLELSNNRTQLYKYMIFDRVRELIWGDMEKNVFGKGVTKFIITNKIFCDSLMQYGHTPLFQNGWLSESFQNELIEFLKKEFPECSIEYIETKGYDNKIIERLFVIDWS